MTTIKERSILHLQMGQEILYLLMAIGLISSLILLMYVRFTQAESERIASTDPIEVQRTIDELNLRLLDVMKEKMSIEEALDKTMRDLKDLEHQLRSFQNSDLSSDDQPPIIVMSETEGYSFPSGSATLSNDFRRLINERIVPKIRQLSLKYNANIVEIIGHTDDVPVRSLSSTIDRMLLRYLNYEGSVEPSASDNVSLGMIRAAAILRVLRSDARLNDLTILPLSAGHTIAVGDSLSVATAEARDDPRRRRIEIRLRRRVGKD